jgi:predicted Holliday junction resolvase-like endonuclease
MSDCVLQLTNGCRTMIAGVIAFILLVCLIVTLVYHVKAVNQVRNQYETELYEAKTRSKFVDEAWAEVEEWKKRYVAERALKEEKEREAEELRKRYWEQRHDDSDSYRTQTRKEEESWGDREPY